MINTLTLAVICALIITDSIIFLIIGWRLGTKVNPEIYYSDKAKKDEMPSDPDYFEDEELNYE